MNRRLLLATVAVALLVAAGGCLDDGPSEDALDEDAEYDWDAEEDALLDVQDDGSFKAVYNVTGRESVDLYRRGITSDSAVPIRAVKYRHPNGTFVNGSTLDVDQGGDRTTVHLPDDEGKLALTGESTSKRLELRAYVGGSYRVILPEGHRADDFLLSDITPRGGYEKETVDDRVHIRWGEIDHDSRITVRYYLQRDRYLFYGLVASLLVVGAGGYLYYNRQIKQLQKRREEHGLDLDDDDVDEKRPPPGMG